MSEDITNSFVTGYFVGYDKVFLFSSSISRPRCQHLDWQSQITNGISSAITVCRERCTNVATCCHLYDGKMFMRSIIIISCYNHYHCCHLCSDEMFMWSVIIGHRPKLAVLPKLVFDAQRPVANIIATANQRIIPSCNPTCLPKNYLYERVAQETTTRKIMHPQ